MSIITRKTRIDESGAKDVVGSSSRRHMAALWGGASNDHGLVLLEGEGEGKFKLVCPSKSMSRSTWERRRRRCPSLSITRASASRVRPHSIEVMILGSQQPSAYSLAFDSLVLCPYLAVNVDAFDVSMAAMPVCRLLWKSHPLSHSPWSVMLIMT